MDSMCHRYIHSTHENLFQHKEIILEPMCFIQSIWEDCCSSLAVTGSGRRAGHCEFSTYAMATTNTLCSVIRGCVYVLLRTFNFSPTGMTGYCHQGPLVTGDSLTDLLLMLIRAWISSFIRLVWFGNCVSLLKISWPDHPMMKGPT